MPRAEVVRVPGLAVRALGRIPEVAEVPAGARGLPVVVAGGWAGAVLDGAPARRVAVPEVRRGPVGVRVVAGVKTVPGMPSTRVAVASSPGEAQSAMSPAPTSVGGRGERRRTAILGGADAFAPGEALAPGRVAPARGLSRTPKPRARSPAIPRRRPTRPATATRTASARGGRDGRPAGRSRSDRGRLAAPDQRRRAGQQEQRGDEHDRAEGHLTRSVVAGRRRDGLERWSGRRAGSATGGGLTAGGGPSAGSGGGTVPSVIGRSLSDAPVGDAAGSGRGGPSLADTTSGTDRQRRRPSR